MKKVIVLLAALSLAACKKENAMEKGLPGEAVNIKVASETEIQKLVPAPAVPAPVGTRAAKKIVINLETSEYEAPLAEGVTYRFWAFNKSVPGPLIRLRVGDEVELHLKNDPSSVLPHNIDLHAVNGPGGGAEATFVAPGKEAVFHFKALNPGLYTYHCAAPPVPQHIANGMYGAILVEPEGGLPKVDREYYIMQSEFYTTGKTDEKGLQDFDMQKGNDEDPSYVVFNGRRGALLGENALQAAVGETVRLFVGNAGPNLSSSFHVIGEVFDNVYSEGGSVINHNLGTTLIPSGGATIVEFKVEVPGSYTIVDHSIFRAFNKGALGQLRVTGAENAAVYKKLK